MGGVGTAHFLECDEPLLDRDHWMFISWEAGLVACGEHCGICRRWGQSHTHVCSLFHEKKVKEVEILSFEAGGQ